MNKAYIEDKKIEKLNVLETPLVSGEYENCTFVDCNLSNADLSGFDFTTCEFIGCNLSMVKMAKTGLKDVKFKNCKLLGVPFQNCNEFLFSVYFDNCILNLSSFYRVKLKKTQIKNTSLHEVDFTECDLTGSHFDNCDLTLAMFENTILEKVDFRTAYNYSINPEINRIKNAKFSMPAVIGLLHKYDIEIEQ